MATQGDSLIKRTQKGLSILAFETTKQSRILKKRMRSAALQKEIKADLRDLGNLVYNAVINEQPGILEEEEVRILVENVRANKEEVERLRDTIARLSRTHKHFDGEEGEFEEPEPTPDERPGPVVEPASPGEAPEAAGAETDAGVDTARELEAAVLDPTPVQESKPKPKKKKPADEKAEAAAVPPAPGTDPGHPEATEATEEKPAE